MVHRATCLPAEDIEWHDDERQPFTTGARTVLDLARTRSLTERLAVLDEGVCAGAAVRDGVHARALALQRGRRGVASIARATAPGAADDFRSWLERRAAGALARGGVPPAEWNVPIRLAGRTLGVIDAFWEWKPLGTDFDGLRFHLPPRQRAHDVARDRTLLLQAGIPIVRYGYADVVDRPERMVAELRRALRSGRVAVP